MSENAMQKTEVQSQPELKGAEKVKLLQEHILEEHKIILARLERDGRKGRMTEDEKSIVFQARTIIESRRRKDNFAAVQTGDFIRNQGMQTAPGLGFCDMDINTRKEFMAKSVEKQTALENSKYKEKLYDVTVG